MLGLTMVHIYSADDAEQDRETAGKRRTDTAPGENESRVLQGWTTESAARQIPVHVRSSTPPATRNLSKFIKKVWYFTGHCCIKRSARLTWSARLAQKPRSRPSNVRFTTVLQCSRGRPPHLVHGEDALHFNATVPVKLRPLTTH
jgi:hypothetical protein